MTKEFDAKNAEKSRRACAAMEDIANSMRRCGEVRHDCEKGAKEVRQENDAVAYVCAKYVKLTNLRGGGRPVHGNHGCAQGVLDGRGRADVREVRLVA